MTGRRGLDVVRRIIKFNAGREPERLAIKYDAMAESPHRFLRGTCHLFFEDWPRSTPLNRAPPTWISGDLHLENFGSYKGDDRLLYFDINDFDEAVLAPCTWELARFVTSLLLVASDNDLSAADGTKLARCFLDAYAKALARGKAFRVEQVVVGGMVRELLDAVEKRRRIDLLRERTELRRGERRLRLGKRALTVTATQCRAVTSLIRQFARGRDDPSFYRVLDVARRVAGTGSLGVQRYVVLVEGQGSPDRNYLIELKEARPSAIAPYAPCRQPRWSDEAQRIVQIQDRMQAMTPALLHSLRMGATPYVLKELQPSQDRLSLDRWHGRMEDLATAMGTMGEAVAWSQLRSAGRQGSAIPDALIAFAARRGWQNDVLKYARQYAKQVKADWSVWNRAMERGEVKSG